MHHGPNGRHRCLVFELMGPDVNNVIFQFGQELGERLEAEDILKI
jgi:hypothetical protein